MKRSFKLYIEKKYIIRCTALKKPNMNDITRLTLLLLITLQSEDAEAKFNFFFIKFQDPCGLNSRIYKGLFRFLQFQKELSIKCSTDLAHIAWQLLYDNRRKPIAIGQWETRVTFKHPTLLLWCYFTQKRVLKKYFKCENYLNLKHIN